MRFNADTNERRYLRPYAKIKYNISINRGKDLTGFSNALVLHEYREKTCQVSPGILKRYDKINM